MHRLQRSACSDSGKRPPTASWRLETSARTRGALPSRRRVAEEVAARERARAQPERVIVTDRAFAVEAKQPLGKHRAQSPSGNQQQPVLRANSYTTSHRVQCIGCKGAPVATRENGLQLLHGGLKRVQERGVSYQVADEFGISAPSLDDRAWIHLCSQEGQGSCRWRRRFSPPPPPSGHVFETFIRTGFRYFGRAR